MGCTNQKLHSQQIAYQRDFLGACWNSSLGEEEADEYLASRWMGISKNIMALYTNNHCFTVRSLNKDEKARAEAAVAGKPTLKAADDPAGIAPGLGGDMGGGNGGVQVLNPSPSPADPPPTTMTGKPLRKLDNTASASAPLSQQSSAPMKPAVAPLTAKTTTTARTTVRQNMSHAYGVSNNSVASMKDDHGASNSMSALNGLGRAPAAEKLKKNSDPAALRNVVKDSVESERIVHADHPYLQRHGLSVYGGVVFRCAPACRLYHRISLVPDVNVRRLYDMQLTAMSHSVMGDVSSSLIGRSGTDGKRSETLHFPPCASSSDSPRIMQSSDAEERGVPPMTPQMPPSNGPSMVPTPMLRPLSKPPEAAIDDSVNSMNRFLGSSPDQSPPLPSLPLGAVPARHLRFASGPEAHQSAVIDAWIAENPLSTFNNYPADDRDVAGVTSSRPPVIIGSVTAMELQALTSNTEICFGGWLYVSLQDEQERLRKSLKRYTKRQRRRAAQAAAVDAMRFPTATSSAVRSNSTPSAQKRRGDPRSTSGADEADAEVEGSAANANNTMYRQRSLTTSPSSMPTLSPQDKASTISESEVPKGSDGSPRHPLPADSLMPVTSRTIAYTDFNSSPLPQALGSEYEGGETVHVNRPDGLDGMPNRTTVGAKSPSADVNSAAVSSIRNGNEAAAASQSATSAPSKETKKTGETIHNTENSPNDITTASSQPPASSPLREEAQEAPLDASICMKVSRSATVVPLHKPSRTPSRLRLRSSSMPPVSMMGPSNNNGSAMPPPLRHTGRYAREAMEADVLNATWLPYAYIVIAVPMYECSLVPTTFHTALMRHKAVSLNLGHALSRQAYGVGCITSVRYGGVMVIEYRDKIDDEDDAEWIAELLQVGKMAQQDANSDEEKGEWNSIGNTDFSASAPSRNMHYSASHHARAEKLRRVKSRIWQKLRRQGLHVVLAATRMADRRHRQHRASIAKEVSSPFNNDYGDIALGPSHTSQHFVAKRRHTTSALPNPPSSTANARRASLGALRTSTMEPVRNESVATAEGGVGAEELNEAMEDAVEEFDSTASHSSVDSDGGCDTFSPPSRPSSHRRNSVAAGGNGDAGGGDGGDSARSKGRSSNKKGRSRWWRSPLSRHHSVTTREDRLRWADPQMTDDFYLRGTFRQIGGMKYLDAVSLMDGCPVSELVQGIKRWVLNLLSMPIKARPICLFLQRYEGIATSLRVLQSQLVATVLASNIALSNQLAQGNLSLHMPSAGVPGADDNNAIMDEISTLLASPHLGDWTMDQVASPSALVNVSFASLQAPAAPPARTLAYQSYYCGPLEPEVRAVLAPETKAMIASCQTRQLPDVLKSPAPKGPAATAAPSSASTADPLSLPPPELLSGTHSANANKTNTTHPVTGQGSTAKAPATPTAASSSLPAAACVAVSTHSAGPLSPNISPSPPAFSVPHCIDVDRLASQQQQQKPDGPTLRNVSLSSLTHAGSMAAVTHPQIKVASPHSSFGAPSMAAKTAGAIEMDSTAGHVRPSANTVPKTITDFLFYDDPTQTDNLNGNSFTAANSQALTAAAAALVLRENVKGPSAVSNASLAAPSVSTGSFPTIHAPGEDPMLVPRHSLNGSSLDHVKGLTEPAAAAEHHRDSFPRVDDGDGAARADKKAVEPPTTNAPRTQTHHEFKSRPAQSSTKEQESGAAPATAASPPQLQQSSATAGNHRDTENNKDADCNEDHLSDEEADEEELEWQLADRELRALKSELDEVTYLTSIARAELLERLEELLLLGAVFLPHTHPGKVDLCLVTMKMLRQYPEEVPVKEIHTDWVPLLMTLLTSSRESLLCSSSHACNYPGWMVGSTKAFLNTYNNIVEASDMCDASKLQQACAAGVTKYTIEPLPPMPAPRQLHDIVLASQPVRVTKALLHDTERIGMDGRGLSFSFSGGSLGVLAGILYYYSDFLRAKYRGEVAAAGGRAKDAGATVLDVLRRGGYNVLLRRIWIWGVMPESKKSKRQIAAAATKTLLKKRFFGEDANSANSASHTPATADEHDRVTTGPAGGGGGSVQAVGIPFRGAEAYALYDAIAHYLRTLEELCMEHNGNSFMTPQTLVKRRSTLMAWRRSKDNEPASVNGGAGTTATNGRSALGDTQNNGLGGFSEDGCSARDLVPTFEVCVATNYYYKRFMDEAHRPVQIHSAGGGGAAGLPCQANSMHIRNGDAVARPSSAADGQARLSSHEDEQSISERQRRWTQAPSSEKTLGSQTITKPTLSSHKNGGGGSRSHDESSVLEKPYCGGEEAMKKDTLQRKATTKFFNFLSDHYEQWRARHSEDKTMNAYGKRICVSMN